MPRIYNTRRNTSGIPGIRVPFKNKKLSGRNGYFIHFLKGDPAAGIIPGIQEKPGNLE